MKRILNILVKLLVNPLVNPRANPLVKLTPPLGLLRGRPQDLEGCGPQEHHHGRSLQGDCPHPLSPSSSSSLSLLLLLHEHHHGRGLQGVRLPNFSQYSQPSINFLFLNHPIIFYEINATITLVNHIFPPEIRP